MLPSLIDASFRLAYRLAYQGMKIYWHILKPQTRGAVVVVRHEERLLFVENSYRPGLALPGGGVGRRESPREAARRELGEEVGIECELEELREVFALDWTVDAKRDEVTLFELQSVGPFEVKIDNREIVAAIWLSVEEAKEHATDKVTQRYLLGL
ncbi:MAG: NUDIX hydrolase [Deltaproteobacteria bacterium]|nr:NUDIX hydrolase [Deltaproteobacteria bacterium]